MLVNIPLKTNENVTECLIPEKLASSFLFRVRYPSSRNLEVTCSYPRIISSLIYHQVASYLAAIPTVPLDVGLFEDVAAIVNKCYKHGNYSMRVCRQTKVDVLFKDLDIVKSILLLSTSHGNK